MAMPITVNINEIDQRFDFSLPRIEHQKVEFDLPEKGANINYPEYTGATEVTPSRETQILHTNKRTVLSDITINPIPENYGLITYDGYKITVS